MSDLINALTERQRLVEERQLNKTKTTARSYRPYAPDNDFNLLSRTDIGNLLVDDRLRLGIDRLAVSFPVRAIFDEDRDSKLDNNGTSRTKRQWLEAHIPCEQSSAYFNVQRRNGGLLAYLDFNPSSILYGKKAPKIATLSEALEVLGELMEEIDYLVDRPIPIPDFSLSRVDITTDFPNVPDIQTVLNHAALHACTRRAKTQAWRSKKGIESVTCRTETTGGWILYDKARQAHLKDAALRCEVTIKRRKLRELGYLTISDLSLNVCRSLFQSTVKNLARSLQEVTRTPIDDILTSATETDILVQQIGHEVLNEHGFFPHIPDSRRRSKFEPFKARYGYTTYRDLLG